MSNRWHVLALFFAIRTTMAFQFQSVAALGPMVGDEFGIGYVELGLLIGLYQSPGMVLALPSGALGRRFGDRACIVAALCLMTTGGVVMGTSAGWELQLAGRLLSGFGGVMVTVMLSKMVADWFTGAEIATAMGLYVNSWGFGIAVALITMPIIGHAIGVRGAYLLAAGVTATAALIFLALYRPPGGATAPAQPASGVPVGRALLGVILAGLIWGLFNAAITMVFSFGNSMLAANGWQIAAAGSIVSLTLWMMVISVPLGGFISDRTKHPMAVLVGGCTLFAILLGVATRTEFVLPVFVALGLVAGLPGGPIMSLPTRVLSPPTRAVGMGIFWTVFYVVSFLAPLVAGYVATATSTPASTFDLGIASLMPSLAVLVAFSFVASTLKSRVRFEPV